MIVASIATPISVSLDERDALRRHLLHTDGAWTWRDWDLPSFAMAWSDSQRLIDALGEGEPPGSTVALRLPPDVLQRVFTDIRDGLPQIDGLDPEQALILAGVCERVLGIVGEAR